MPSWILDRLQLMGVEVRNAYTFARGPHQTPGMAETLAREVKRRSDLYDQMLSVSLDLVDRVRDARGEIAAQAIERHFIDGQTWEEVGSELGIGGNRAAGIAIRSLDWLDKNSQRGGAIPLPPPEAIPRA